MAMALGDNFSSPRIVWWLGAPVTTGTLSPASWAIVLRSVALSRKHGPAAGNNKKKQAKVRKKEQFKQARNQGGRNGGEASPINFFAPWKKLWDVV